MQYKCMSIADEADLQANTMQPAYTYTRMYVETASFLICPMASQKRDIKSLGVSEWSWLRPYSFMQLILAWSSMDHLYIKHNFYSSSNIIIGAWYGWCLYNGRCMHTLGQKA